MHAWLLVLGACGGPGPDGGVTPQPRDTVVQPPDVAVRIDTPDDLFVVGEGESVVARATVINDDDAVVRWRVNGQWVDGCAGLGRECVLDGLENGLVELCAEVDGAPITCVGGRVDPCVPVTWYPDRDGDGFGDLAESRLACTGDAGWLREAGDCDDQDPATHPGAGEHCDGRDEDCDGLVDEDASDPSSWYRDADGDGFGDPADAVAACTPPLGRVATPADCDDAHADVNPRGEERCNGVDDDCDGDTDEATASDAGAWYTDTDGDGYGDPATAVRACAAPAGFVADAGDCDDGDAKAHPAGVEMCDGDDDDCDGDVDEPDATDAVVWYADADGDGYGAASVTTRACTAPAGYIASVGDCDDGDAGEHPGGVELCDGDDDDCDGEVDEPSSADATTWFADKDGDGWGDATSTRAACAQPAGYVATPGDCDDSTRSRSPDAVERCDGADDDCDGTVDEDDAVDARTWYADADGDGQGDPARTHVACAAAAGEVATALDCDDTDVHEYPGADERCDGDDDDCDGVVDEDDAVDAPTWYTDADGDGAGDPAKARRACSPLADEKATGLDCDDTDAGEYPGADERCDGDDDDCDGTVDEDDAVDAPTWFADVDGDGFGDAALPTVACSAPAAFVSLDTDCDDKDAATFPGADEWCDGEDDDCDGVVDEADAVDAASWYMDGDGDGAGDASASTVACAAPAGFVADDTDCDDADPGAYVGAVEICDGVDDDCDGTADEGDAAGAPTFFRDADGDGTGVSTSSVTACAAPEGYVVESTDCDDGDADEHVGADERCDGDDDDCDGEVDEDDAVDASTWYRDADADTFGDDSDAVVSCEAPTGYVADGTDCDDGDGAAFPGSVEVCGGGDEDCDGAIDEDDAEGQSTWFADTDGDGYGDATVSSVSCAADANQVADDTDCDDADPTAYPDAPEQVDGVDDDCDGTIDDVSDPWQTDLVDNGSFETGDLTDWTLDEGGCQVLRSSDLSWIDAYDGDWMLYGGRSLPGDCVVYQDLDLLSLGFDADDLDSGYAALDAMGAVAHYMDAPWGQFPDAFYDRTFVRIRYLDEVGDELGSVKSLLSEQGSWDLRGFGGLVPAGTRTLRVEVEAQWWRGNDADAVADAIEASLEPATPASPSITLKPTLQDYRTDAMRILWETDGNLCDNSVTWRPTDGSADAQTVDVVDTVQVDETHFVHVAEITGLSGATSYDYYVQSGDTTSSTYTFTTAPNPGDDLRIAWVSDPDGQEVNFAQVLADVRTHDPDFFFLPGDNVWNGDEVADWHDEWYGPLEVGDFSQTTPILFARGNHDAEHALSYAYSALPGNERWYSFTYGNVFVVVLDSEGPSTGPDDRIDQQEYLIDQLSSAEALAADFRIVTFHIPPYTYTRHDNWQHGSTNAVRDWVPVFEAYDVDMVICGHFGSYQRGDYNGVNYLVIGGGGGVIDRESTGDALWMDVVERMEHYAIMDVSGSTMTWTSYDLDGNVIDSLTITH